MHELDIHKAIQTVGVVLRREGKHISRLRLLKLLYIADRVSLQRAGAPILGSKLVAMKHGPLHSEVLDVINGNSLGGPEWSRYFRTVGRDIVLEQEPEVGKLSRYEIDLLNEVVDGRIGRDDWDVADETHDFQEWREAYPNPAENTSRPISTESLLEAVGRGGDKAAILQDIKDTDAFEKFFAGISQ